jgi:hypothetical protein
MVQSPSWEANWFAASQEIPRSLCYMGQNILFVGRKKKKTKTERGGGGEICQFLSFKPVGARNQ